MQAVNDALIEETELRLLLEGVRNCYGFDFRDYAPEPLKRRIWERVHAEGAQTLSGYQEKVLHEPTCMEHLLRALRDNETGLFDDPGFWLAFRRMVVPLLRTYPSIQIWVPECAGGNDVYSLAILLHEEGVLHRARIYATDLSETILCHTREAVVPLSRIANDTEQYLRAGGSRSFSEYYRTERDRAIVSVRLMDRIVFAEHNLATDGPFNEFQSIVCRRALSSYNQWLQEHVHDLFMESLSRFGVLALGPDESPIVRSKRPYEELPGVANLYRKVE